MALSDLIDYFGATTVKEVDDVIQIRSIDITKLLSDIDTIWRNKRVAANLFTDVRKYRISFDRFYAPDIHYVLQQIYEYKQRKSSKYRIKQAITGLLTETWFKSSTEQHPDILDFTALKRLRHTLFAHQIDTLKVYNDKVPKMQLKGFLLGTPPGCLSGDTRIAFNRAGKGFTTTIATAYKHFNQQASNYRNWDPSIPTYVRSYTGKSIRRHRVVDIVYSGLQRVYLVRLVDGKSIKCTFNHEIMTSEGFVAANAIIGKRVMCDSKYSVPYYVRAVAFEPLDQEPTYDIICEDPHRNFAANDMIVHNSGKTIMSIGLSVCLHADVTFFIVPKNTVTTVWFDGIVDELGNTVRVWASTHDTPLSEDYDYYIFHYEALPLALFLAERLRGKGKTPFIAIDESHNLNEITSTRTQRLVELTKRLDCQNTVYATGTPIKAVGLEVIPLLRAIDTLFTPAVEASFRAIFGATAKRANDILRNRLGLISHRINESSYMTAPPPKEINLSIKIPNSQRFTIKVVQAEMKKYMAERYKFYQANMRKYVQIYQQGVAYYERTLTNTQQRAQLKQYKDYVKIIIEGYDPIAHAAIAKFVKEFETQQIIPSLPQGSQRNTFKDAISVVKYVKMRVLGEALAVFARHRAECAAELAKYGNLDDIVTAADKKTIIFSSFIPALVAGNAYFQQRGFKTLQIFGEFTKDLAGIVNQFKRDPDLNPLFGTLQSLAASQTLIVANVVIFLDAPFREYIRDQAFHRVFRIGQDVQTYIYMCLLDTGSEPNISTRSQDILAWSQSQVTEIFGSASKEEAEGIVKRLHLNPTGVEMLLGMIKRLKLF